MKKRIGGHTVALQNPPSITAYAAIVGSEEGKGPLAAYFDEIIEDPFFGEDSWEKAESTFLKTAMNTALKKAKLVSADLQYILAGDLLNQCVSAHYAVRDSGVPFFGLYGACSTMAESLSLASMIVDGEYADRVLAGTSSHFCAAEKQFRFPLDYGGQKTPTAQRTVTGSGCAIVSSQGQGPYITHITTGKIVDMGISDVNNMGAAMAPAAADTLAAHFKDTGFSPKDYDLIVTGDLGVVGKELAISLLKEQGIQMGAEYNDCGCMIFDLEGQDVHAGGSGCGCSASVLCGRLLDQVRRGDLKRLLFVATGALMSPTTTLQGETIPCIAHAVRIVWKKEEAQ